MMNLTKVLLIALCLLPSSAISGGKYINGWSEETYRVAIRSCTEAAVNSNMQYLIAKGHITSNASAKEKKEIREKLTTLQSAVCECALNKIMNDYHFNDLDKIKEYPDYRKKVLESCHAIVKKNSGL